MVKSATTEEVAIAMTPREVKWGDQTLGTPATVSYGFLDYGIKFTEAQIAATEDVLNLWSDVANITFVSPTTGLGDSPYISGGIASLVFVNYSDPNDPAYARGGGTIEDGYARVRFNMANPALATFAPGGYDMEALIHETGHAIGLGHPGDYDPGVPESEWNQWFYQDTLQYTVMSYYPETDSFADFQGNNVSTPLLIDIAAAQRLYGANMTTRTGDTTYGFHSNADREAFHIDNANEEVVFTIWDAGGTDTLDLSGYSEDQRIDLTPGAFSDAGGLKGNIAMADAVDIYGNNSWEAEFNANNIANYIENAKGGSGDDRIAGNVRANVLDGGAGKDTLVGGAGGDMLLGGVGNDTLYGGADGDTLLGGVGNDTLDGGADGDTMDGGIGDDTYIVDNRLDRVVEGPGYLIPSGGTGIGPRGSDTATSLEFVDGGTDTVQTSLRNYTLGANVENLTLAYKSAIGKITAIEATGTGNELDNVMKGSRGHDTLIGLGGDDTLDGGYNSDRMLGGADDDTYYVDNAGDVVDEEVQFGTRSGLFSTRYGYKDAGGVDTVVTSLSTYDLSKSSSHNSPAFSTVGATLFGMVENLKYNGTGSFVGTGNDLDNVIEGGALNDTLRGMGGSDTLNGWGGADTMQGGANDDTYIVDNVGDVVDEEVQFGTRSGLFSTRYGYRDAGGEDTVITSLSTYDLSKTSSHGSVALSAGGTLFGMVENLKYYGTGSFVGTGNDLNNRITGGASADILAGGDGNDILEGNGGADTLLGGADNDTLKLSGPPDTWLGLSYIDGDTGVDTLDLSAAASGISVDLAAGSWGSWDARSKTASSEYVGRFTGIENVTGTEHGDKIVGDSGSNVLSGLGGADILEGGGGNDKISGGDGFDTIVMRGAVGDLGLDSIDGGADGDTLDFSGLEGSIQINLGAGTLGIVGDLAAASFAGIRSIEHVEGTANDDVITGSFEENLIRGGAGVDTIDGAGGRDQLDGGAGADIMIGGGDDDQYMVDNVGDQIREVAGEGTDTVITLLAEYTLGENLENLVSAVSEQDFHGVGNALDNKIYSDGGNDALDGGAGNDRLVSDRSFFGIKPSTRDTLIGGAGDDTLTGGGAADLFVYRDGDLGHDTITDFNEAEGDRIDFSGVTGATSFASLTATADAQGDALLSFGDISMTLEGVTLTSLDGTEFVFAPEQEAVNAVTVLTGATAGEFLEIDGGAGDDKLMGGDGEEWFDGREGLDTMVFSGNYANYTLFENFGGWTGWTMILNNATGVEDWTIRVENLQFADQLVTDPTLDNYINGTSEADTLVGTDGMDVLAGGDGADVLRAGGGEDALYIDNFDTVIDGGDGLDVVYVNESANQSGLNFKMAGTNVEHVWSGMGDDVIDTRGLELQPGPHAVTSRGGDDIVIAGDSNLSFDGGVGEDTLVLAGNRGDYTFALPASGVGIITNTASGATDYVLSVENFEFADGTFSHTELFVVG